MYLWEVCAFNVQTLVFSKCAGIPDCLHVGSMRRRGREYHKRNISTDEGRSPGCFEPQQSWSWSSRCLHVLGSIIAIEKSFWIHKCHDRLVRSKLRDLNNSDQNGFHASEQSVDRDQIDVNLALLGQCVGVNTSDIFEYLIMRSS